MTDKPSLLTEFSIDATTPPNTLDPAGVHLSQGSWAALMGGTAGGGMSWWWEAYIDRLDLYDQQTSLARFADTVNWQAANPQFTLPAVQTMDNNATLRLEDFNRDFDQPPLPTTLFYLTQDGMVPSLDQFSAFMYGSSGNPERSLPRSIRLHAPTDTVLNIGIRDVSSLGGAELVVSLDNQVTASLTLAPGNNQTRLTVPIPAGEHTLVLDNLGDFWFELDYLEFQNYVTPIRAFALADRDVGMGIAYLQNQGYGYTADTLPDAINGTLILPGMLPGIYEVDFWDVQRGVVVGQDEITVAEDGQLRVPLLPIQRDLALHALRIGGESIMAQLPTPAATRTPLITATLPPSETPTATLTLTTTPTVSPTMTATQTPSNTPTDTLTPTATATHSDTPTVTATPSATNTATLTISPTASQTPSNTVTPSSTPSPSVTPSLTASPTVSLTPSETEPVPRVTRTPAQADPLPGNPFATVEQAQNASSTVTASSSPTNAPTATPTPLTDPATAANQSGISRATRTPRPNAPLPGVELQALPITSPTPSPTLTLNPVTSPEGLVPRATRTPRP